MTRGPDASHAAAHRFVVPDLAGPNTGGTVYNRELVGALRQGGAAVAVLDVAGAERAVRAGEPGRYWVDTLFLEAVPTLAAQSHAGQRVGLIAHYLPGLVRYGARVTRKELSLAEIAALDGARAFLAPSALMRRTLVGLGVAERSVAVVEPGTFATRLAALPAPSATLRALVVAHLVAGKGVARLLSALATRIAANDRLTLELIGRDDADPAYASACRVFSTAPSLRGRVTLASALTPREVVARLAASDLVLSASQFESFGMALAEARTLGVPIVARRGGNVESLVDPESGGELVADASSVAAACLALCRDRVELGVRREMAQKNARTPRAWSQVADEFLACVTRM
jgi:glycosyltransferase involved in cell wall biosynthesis